MRIIYIAREKLITGDAQTIQILNTLRGIAEAGAELVFVTPWSARHVRRQCRQITGCEFPNSIQIHSLGHGPQVLMLSRAWPSASWSGILHRLQQFLKSCDGSSQTVLYTRNRRVAAAISSDLPLVFEYHELRSRSPNANQQRFRFEEHQAFSRAAALVTLTHCLKSDIQEQFAYQRPISVVPDGVDARIFGACDNASRIAEPRLLYVGSTKAWKGLPTALMALSQIPKAKLDICGTTGATAAELLALAKQIGVQSQVTLHPWVPQCKLGGMFARATAGLLPLNGDFAVAARYTSPLKLFEYLAAGLPVIASDLPSVREVITHEREGLLFPHGDHLAMADCIQRLIGSSPLASRLAANSRHLGAEFSWKSRGTRVVKACQQTLAGRSGHTVPRLRVA